MSSLVPIGRGPCPVLVAVLAVVLASCGGSPSASFSPQASPSATLLAQPAFPAGCTPITLRSPSGALLDLSGAWAQARSSAEDQASGTTWWIRQLGDCVSGVWMSAEFPDAPIQGYDLQALRGIVDPSFVIEGELVEVAPMDMPGERAFPFVAPIRLLIEFDAGGAIVLREDREYGDPGPRCPDPAFHCLVPLVLTRID